MEGFAYASSLKKFVLHAWLTDGEFAFDPTWKAFDKETGKEVAPTPVNYIGIEMDIKLVAEFMLETGYQGIFANGWRSDALAREILGLPPIFTQSYLDRTIKQLTKSIPKKGDIIQPCNCLGCQLSKLQIKK